MEPEYLRFRRRYWHYPFDQLVIINDGLKIKRIYQKYIELINKKMQRGETPTIIQNKEFYGDIDELLFYNRQKQPSLLALYEEMLEGKEKYRTCRDREQIISDYSEYISEFIEELMKKCNE